MSALRSHNRFDKKDLDGFFNRSSLKAEGFSALMFDGRPVVGIANSWAELTSYNAHRDRPGGGEGAALPRSRFLVAPLFPYPSPEKSGPWTLLRHPTRIGVHAPSFPR